MPTPRISVRYTIKKSDGNYGSREISMSIEQDVAGDLDRGFNQLYKFLKLKVEAKLNQ